MLLVFYSKMSKYYSFFEGDVCHEEDVMIV